VSKYNYTNDDFSKRNKEGNRYLTYSHQSYKLTTINKNMDQNTNPNNFNNNNNQNFNPSPQPQQPPQPPQQQSFPPHEPPQPPKPQSPVDLPPMGDKPSWGWVGWLVLVVLVVAVLYFTNAWNWLGNLVSPVEAPEETTTEEEVVPSEEQPINGGQTNTEKPANQEIIEAGKGKVSILISSFLPGGVTLSTGTADPNIEIRKVYLHNPENTENPWLLVYDGFRPLDLNLLNATGEKHELIATRLSVAPYDRMKIELADLVKIDPRGDQKVARLRTVTLGLFSVIEENQQNTIDISFNISNKPNQPQPIVKIND